MYIKLIAGVLVGAFLNLLGCASIKSFTPSEYLQSEAKDDKPEEILVITKDGKEYHYKDPTIIFEDDSLHVRGILTTKAQQDRFNSKTKLNRNFALSNVEKIQVNTILVSGSTFLYTIVIGAGIYLVLSSIETNSMHGGISFK